MSTHKHIDKICLVAALLALVLAGVFANGEAFGIQAASNVMGYEERLFDTSQVHTIEIEMDDWDRFIQTCENEEYAVCSVVIDGETYANIGIRAKGNTSLSTVSSMDSDRYSFKIEFDQYDATKSYHGLDKLSLNNVIQDNTFMKDYLTYQMMGQFDVAAPLCSYVYITVNGEDWGLYLAVEGLEESFLQRNYGNDYGDLYKPDSLSFGGGWGNGQNFNMQDFNMEDFAIEGFDIEDFNMEDFMSGEEVASPESGSAPPDQVSGRGEGGRGGMGSSDVKLQYIDDDPDSYSNIFSSAKTEVTDADMARLIQALKSLSEGENIPSVVDVEAVIRYFVVHNFVCNGDSYTGNMLHNYYLYEENGQLSMLPWDYNLAFGTFQSGDATEMVNKPIDTPVSGGTGEDRPMVNWIFSSEEYTQLYHQYFAEFLESTDFAALIDETAALVAPYVEKDPSKFCTYEEFEAGVAAIRAFCLLREESVLGQLEGTIPSTEQGQSEDASMLIDASHITLSNMGTMNMGGGRGGNGGGPGGFSFDGENTVAGGGSLAATRADETTIADTVTDTKMQEKAASSLPMAGEGQNSMPMPGGSKDFGGAVGGKFSVPGGDLPAAPGSADQQSYTETVMLLGTSMLFLLVGLLIAFKFKR